MIKPLIEKEWYKSCSPEETINNIRNILHKVGIFLTEESGSCSGFYHSHVYVSNENLRQFNIVTNGKGRSPAYALASAYSEMMERLQNGYKFYGTRFATSSYLDKLSKNNETSEYINKIKATHAELQYTSYPDEIHLSLNQYLNSRDNIFTESQTKYILKHGSDPFLNDYDICCVPYTRVFDGKERLLPTDCYNSGSNGMCAGNTPAEALVQGFCELFERYALKKIFIDQAIPPQIPLAYFEGTSIYNRIHTLSDTKVVILDCSFGYSLPVIGAIVINTKDNSYCIEMAGAATATVALERCMTEHFQDGDPSDEMPSIYEKIIFDRNHKYEQFYKQSGGFGKFDVRRILYGTAEYEFSGFYTIMGNSHEEELNFIIRGILIPGNLDCYIRDNSILGFPTYHIYIPEMSDIYDNCNEDDLYITMMSFYLQPKIMALKNQDSRALLEICKNVQTCYSKVRSSHIHIFSNFLYNSYCRQNRPDIDLLLATIYLQCEERRMAIEELEKFVQKLNSTNDHQAIRYYNCILDHLCKSDSQALNTLYDKFLLEEVEQDLATDNQLQYYELPSCFNCEACDVKDYCCYTQAMSLVKKIQENTVLRDQVSLRTMITKIMEDVENPEKSRHNFNSLQQ